MAAEDDDGVIWSKLLLRLTYNKVVKLKLTSDVAVTSHFEAEASK